MLPTGMQTGARLEGLEFARHQAPQLCAAVQDGIAAALAYGSRALSEVGAAPKLIRAGRANLFQSERFCQAFTEMTGVPLQLYQTDGAQGAARAAGVGIGVYSNEAEALSNVEQVRSFEPGGEDAAAYRSFYEEWVAGL